MLFLKEAFIDRKNCLQGFLNEFQMLISEVLDAQIDIVCLAKIAECICLFEPARLDLLLLKIFIKKHSWVNEIALKSCVGFCRINRNIEYCCYAYFNSLKDKEFIKKYSNFKFIFSTYKSYRVINIYMRLKLFDLIVTCLTYVGIIGLIFSREILVYYYLFTQNRAAFTSCFTAAICFMLIDIMKHAFPRFVLFFFLYFKMQIGNNVSAYVCSLPIHLIFQFLRTGIFSDKNMDEIMERLKKRNISVLKNIVYIIIGLIFGAIVTHISERFFILIGYICGFIILVIFLIGFLKAVFNMIAQFKYKKYKIRKNMLKIERSSLEKNLQHMHSKKEKAAYLDSLNENQVFLVGNWTNNKRPSLGDENADRLLAMLDIKDLNIKL